MGFGILTVGYYIAYLVGMIWQSEIWGALLILLGCVMIAAALLRLSEYEQGFRHALFFGILLILTAVYRVLFWLSSNLLWDVAFFSDYVSEIVLIVEFILFLVFQGLLLLSVRKLASDVEVPKIVSSATRNLVFLGIFGVIRLVAALPFPAAAYFSLSATLVQIVYHILIGIMLGSCYMRICDEGDEDMPLKKSRFAWVNRFREERARREQRAADSVTEYAENKLRKQKAEREKILGERKENRKNGKGKRR